MRTWGARNSQSFATSQAQAATSWKTEIAGFRWLWCPSVQLVLIFCPSSHMHNVFYVHCLSATCTVYVGCISNQPIACHLTKHLCTLSFPRLVARGRGNETSYVMWCASFNLYRALKLVLPTPKDCCWHDRLFSLKHFGPYQFLMYIQWVVYHDNCTGLSIYLYLFVVVTTRVFIVMATQDKNITLSNQFVKMFGTLLQLCTCKWLYTSLAWLYTIFITLYIKFILWTLNNFYAHFYYVSKYS